MSDKIFVWDHHSDQPYPIADRAYKKHIYKKALPDMLKMFATSLALAPAIALKYLFIGGKKPDMGTLFGMGVNLDQLPEDSPALIKELGISHLLIRLSLNDMANLPRYLEFVQSFKGAKVTLNILQDREHITDPALLERDLRTIFETFAPHIEAMQIGNAINRKKWAFFTMGEYMRFFAVARRVQRDYPHIELIGSSTIDFEYHYTIRTLFNGFKQRFDKVASLLYVDRRGAPENRQMGFDLFKKIKLLYAIVALSSSPKRLIISEMNWPISHTAPYAPTSEKECVSEEVYRNYLVRTYLIAAATGMVETMYWHQLAASGYGLIDLREGVRKREAFEAMRVMVSFLQKARLRSYRFDETYEMRFESDTHLIEVFWATAQTRQEIEGELYDILGKRHKRLHIGQAPLYRLRKIGTKKGE